MWTMALICLLATTALAAPQLTMTTVISGDVATTAGEAVTVYADYVDVEPTAGASVERMSGIRERGDHGELVDAANEYDFDAEAFDASFSENDRFDPASDDSSLAARDAAQDLKATPTSKDQPVNLALPTVTLYPNGTIFKQLPEYNYCHVHKHLLWYTFRVSGQLWGGSNITAAKFFHQFDVCGQTTGMFWLGPENPAFQFRAKFHFTIGSKDCIYRGLLKLNAPAKLTKCTTHYDRKVPGWDFGGKGHEFGPDSYGPDSKPDGGKG